MQRRKTKAIMVGSVQIGGDAPISVQSMCNTHTEDIDKTVEQIIALEKVGCEIIRVAVPTEEAAQALKHIREQIHIPLVADIHFNYKLAVLAAAHVDKLRVNVGNIHNQERIFEIVNAAKEYGIPIRIGVNLGSLENELMDTLGKTPEAMVESAMRHIDFLEKQGFYDIIVSLKASDTYKTIRANELIAERIEYPIHLGITQAGTLYAGMIRSAVGLGALLVNGIGDTIRLSLTSRDKTEEVKAGYEILRSLGLRNYGRQMICCPTCGRAKTNSLDIVDAIERATAQIREPVKIAVMGCEVNGPEEAKDADIGIFGSNGNVVIMMSGQIIRKAERKDAVPAFLLELNRYLKDTYNVTYDFGGIK